MTDIRLLPSRPQSCAHAFEASDEKMTSMQAHAQPEGSQYSYASTCLATLRNRSILCTCTAARHTMTVSNRATLNSYSQALLQHTHL